MSGKAAGIRCWRGVFNVFEVVSLLIFWAVTLKAMTAFCKYGLLANTLFKFEDYACENELLRLSCPHGSQILVEWAQYGRLADGPRLCLPLTWRPRFELPGLAPTAAGVWTATANRSTVSPAVTISSENGSSTDCLSSASLEVVTKLCGERRRCSIRVKPSTFGEDPCPKDVKYLLVSYRCQPQILHNRTVCKGSTLAVRCPKNRVIAMHSAMFGYSAPGVPECPSLAAYNSDCRSACSMQTVTRLCHGQRRCQVAVTAELFGTPCRTGTSEYLSTVHACVDERTLTEIKDDIFPYSLCREQEHLMFSTTTDTSSFLDWFTRSASSTDNTERLFLCLALSVCVGIIVVLLVIIIRLAVALYRYWYILNRLPPRPSVSEAGSSRLHPSPTSGGGIEDTDDGRLISSPPGVHRPYSRGGPPPDSPELVHLPADDSPVFVHVESPRESPLLGRGQNGASLERRPPAPAPVGRRQLRETSPVWVRLVDSASSPEEPSSSGLQRVGTSPRTSSPDDYDDSSIWLPVSVTPMGASSTALAEPGGTASRRSTLRRAGESPLPALRLAMPESPPQAMSRSYSNPYRQDTYRVERRSQTAQPPRKRRA